MGASIKDDSSEEPISEINIVPFVDIILVVLIIFMVTTPFIMNPSLPVNLPDGSSAEKTAPSPFQIVVNKDGYMALNGKSISIEDLKLAAREFARQNPAGNAIISADQSTPHGKVMEVIDKIKLEGITKFGISMDSK